MLGRPKHPVLEETDVGGLRPARLVPSGPLGRFVAELTVTVRAPAQSEHVGLPQGYADMVFRLFNGGARQASRPGSSDLHAVGTQRQAFCVPVSDIRATVVIRFRPGGAYPFFRLPMRDLADQVLPIEDLWGASGRALHERLMERADTAGWLALIQDALLARMQRADDFEPAPAQAASVAVRAIVRSPAIPALDAVTAELGICRRQLRRIFNEAVGMGPKAFARIVRFDRTIRAVESVGAPDWADIAAGAGYYDQAHLIRECHGFTGMTPTAFLRLLKSTRTTSIPA
jgi:AraC-like DNA-binding protein